MLKHGKRGLAVFFILFLSMVFGCSSGSSPEPKAEAKITKAVAVLQPTQVNSTKGTVTFTKVDKGVRVVANIEGLTPGKHGFHIHEFGDCSAPDAASAGDHFNPAAAPHGGAAAEKRHVGDLGNIEADASGVGKLDWIDPHLSFEGPNSILGRAVIVHAKPDDLTTQPTGGAGPRLACGVIGVAK